jgi:hypothetical protein
VLTYPMQTMISVRERTTRSPLVTHSPLAVDLRICSW